MEKLERIQKCEQMLEKHLPVVVGLVFLTALSQIHSSSLRLESKWYGFLASILSFSDNQTVVWEPRRLWHHSSGAEKKGGPHRVGAAGREMGMVTDQLLSV